MTEPDAPKKIEREVEEAFEMPARILEEGVTLVEEGEKRIVEGKVFKGTKSYLKTLGPGLTTGAADDDPSGIATYSQAGAQYGLQLIWTSLFTYPFMSVVQEMCARIGIVSGQGLAANIRKHFSPGALYLATGLLFLANTLNIAADLGAMAAASRLLLPSIQFDVLIILFAAVSLLLQVFVSYAAYAKYLKYLTFTLLAYVVVALAVHLDWGEVLYRTFVPSITFSSDQLFLICAILGTTISPYLFFWQTSQEVEEDILRGETSIEKRRAEATPAAIKSMRVDVWSGMAFSNLISFFIFAACAGTLYANGITHIATADQAALALKPFGTFAYLLFALGIIGTGMLAIPVFAGSTAYALSESFGWKYGLYRKLKEARAFYGVIIVSVVLGIVAGLMHLDPIKGLIYAAVANGFIAPIILYFVVKLSGDKKIMREHANGRLGSIFGWTTIVVMAISGIAAIVTLFY